jgi:two-component system NtrC family sensor kinase
VMASQRSTSLGEKIRQKLESAPGGLRVSGLQGKLIIPYVMLTMALAAIGIFVITRLVTSSIRERFINQIYEAARVASDAVVRQEMNNLEDLRAVVFTEGVNSAVARKDPGVLEGLLLNLMANNRIEALTVIDSSGAEILTLGENPATGQFVRSSAEKDFSDNELVDKALSGAGDEQGDKYVGILATGYGPALFTAAPVYNDHGDVIGAVLVGVRLETLLAEIKTQALADIILFDQNGQILASTLPEAESDATELANLTPTKGEPDKPNVYDLKLYNRDFQITYTELEARQEQFGWLGVVLPSTFVVSTEATSRDLFSLIFALGTVAIVIVGYAISQSIARPILKLRTLTQSVAAGDLDQSMGIKRADEIGELGEAFDVMTIKLRERTLEAARLYSEAIQRNKELAETNERLRTTQMQLIQSEKLAAIGQLTAGIVHDVKNPLAVIKGVAELMLSEESLPEYTQELSLIRESAQKANNIVSDLMKFARQSQPEMGIYDMRDTVEAALRLTAFPIRKAHVQAVKDIPEHAVVMTYDYQQIEQVLVNLINNAVQAMPNGGSLRVSLGQADGVTAISVQDTGIGIPSENLSRIFDPFFTTKPEGEGTGLGLSVSYGIISNHSGRIEVESVPGEGTTFTLLLPAPQPESMEVAQ